MNTLNLAVEISFSEEPALDEAIENLINAHHAYLWANTNLANHKKTTPPAIRSAYASYREYQADDRANREWYDRHVELADALDAAWRDEQAAIFEAREYLPYEIWFKHGRLAVAIIGGDEDTPPLVAVAEWDSSYMPDLRNTEMLTEFLSVYPRIIG